MPPKMALPWARFDDDQVAVRALLATTGQRLLHLLAHAAMLAGVVSAVTMISTAVVRGGPRY